ncbi:MAG: hypothetical protein R3D28_23835 [Geminicoccaceae bacterium]
MKIVARMAGITFGVMMLALSFAIAAETLLRKFFAYSFGGIDELGGYAVAIAGPLAFTVAAVEQAHIQTICSTGCRLEVARGVLNVVAAKRWRCSPFLFLLYFTIRTVQDTSAYRSIAQTPWRRRSSTRRRSGSRPWASSRPRPLVLARRRSAAWPADWAVLDRRWAGLGGGRAAGRAGRPRSGGSPSHEHRRRRPRLRRHAAPHVPRPARGGRHRRRRRHRRLARLRHAVRST